MGRPKKDKKGDTYTIVKKDCPDCNGTGLAEVGNALVTCLTCQGAGQFKIRKYNTRINFIH